MNVPRDRAGTAELALTMLFGHRQQKDNSGVVGSLMLLDIKARIC